MIGRARHWIAHLGMALLSAVVLLPALATPAFADPDQPVDLSDPSTYEPIELGQTPVGLAWIELTDTRGISLWNFEMSLDRGSPITPMKSFWAVIVDQCWGIYRSFCALALWFIDWVTSLTWMDFFAAPLLTIGDAMQSVLSGLGLVPTFMTLSVLMAGIWMIRGRTSTAVYEVAIACVVAALAAGVFAHPVRMVAGPDGLIVNAAQIGQGFAAELATGGAEGKTAEQLRRDQTGKLVDVFIRQPTQMMNFGRVLDGTKCESAYNDVVKDGPYGNDSDIRDKVADCDKGLGEYAANPSASMAIGAFMFMPAAFVVLLFGGALGGAVIAAGVGAMYQSMKAIVTLITGLLPGGGRGSLMLTVAEVINSMLVIVFASVFMSVFLLVIESLFTNEAGSSVPQMFIFIDIALVLGLIVFVGQHKQIKALRYRMAEWMARRPGGTRRGVQPTRLPDRQPGLSMPTVASVAHIATDLARARRERRSAGAVMGPTFVDNRSVHFGGGPGAGGTGPVDLGPIPWSGPGGGAPPTGGSGGRGGPRLPGGGGGQLPSGGSGRPGLPPGGPGSPGLPPGGPGAPQLPAGPSAGRLQIGAAGKKAVGVLARAGAHAVLASATGGGSAVAAGAVRAGGALRAARRAALASRMAVGAGKSAAGVGRPPAVAGQPRRTVVPARPVSAPPAGSGAGKGVRGVQGKGGGPAGKGPEVVVLRPGDPGYLTPREALARRNGETRSAAYQADQEAVHLARLQGRAQAAGGGTGEQRVGPRAVSRDSQERRTAELRRRLAAEDAPRRRWRSR